MYKRQMPTHPTRTHQPTRPTAAPDRARHRMRRRSWTSTRRTTTVSYTHLTIIIRGFGPRWADQPVLTQAFEGTP
ncbi:hypothetical protein [Arthrobacter sp. KBS0703]|uniref:hypothetical protein n=1 Tax=Arthrobacter sp. KBS0703 TaxID=1955698 RepID=UPI0021B10222|nr:hypothetical protein [Arthrobacter sp. KBS0703]